MSIIDDFKVGDLVKYLSEDGWNVYIVDVVDNGETTVQVWMSSVNKIGTVYCEYIKGIETLSLKKFNPTELEKLVFAIPESMTHTKYVLILSPPLLPPTR